MARYITFKRIYQRIWLLLSNLPMSGHSVRPLFVKMGEAVLKVKHSSVRIENPLLACIAVRSILVLRGLLRQPGGG